MFSLINKEQFLMYTYITACFRFPVAEAGFDWCVATSREKCSQEKSADR